jgi:methyl-accepting chemotaxis protein
VDGTVKESVAFADGSMADYEARVTSMLWMQGIALALAAMLLLSFGTWIRRAIWAAVGGEPLAAAAMARAVSQGDLTIRLQVPPGDRSSIVAALQDMQRSLAQVVRNVREGSQGVATASSEIAQGNHDLSGRTESQAGAL